VRRPRAPRQFPAGYVFGAAAAAAGAGELLDVLLDDVLDVLLAEEAAVLLDVPLLPPLLDSGLLELSFFVEL
jgi:hypothetical protein